MQFEKLMNLVDSDEDTVINVAKKLSDEDLDEIAKLVLEDYMADENSRNGWLTKTKKVLELDMQIKKGQKTTPWLDACDVKYPLISVGSIAFASRLYPEIIRKEGIVKYEVYGADPDGSKALRGRRISDHMNYQLLHEMNWEQETDKLLRVLPIVGTVFRKVHYDYLEDRPISEFCDPQDIIVNNYIHSLNDAQRITHRYYLSRNQIKEKMSSDQYLELDFDDLHASVLRERPLNVREDQFGDPHLIKNTSDKFSDNSLHEILEQHRFLDLDGDGYEEPYVVVIHKHGEKVLGIYPRFDPMEDVIVNDKGKILKIKPTNYFVDYHFVPAPDGGFYSYGFGHMLYPINHTINSVTNNLVDSGTLANLQGGFINGLFNVSKGVIEATPGSFIPIDVPPNVNLAQQVLPFTYKEPSAVLFQLLQFLVGAGEQLASITDILLGNANPQNSPAGAVGEMASQGLKPASAVSKRVYNALDKELKSLFKINMKAVSQGKLFKVKGYQTFISADDYKDADIMICPVADPQLSSESQKIAQANMMIQLGGIPAYASVLNPREVLTQLFTNLRMDGIEKLVPAPDPNAPPPIQERELQMKVAKVQTDAQLKDKELSIKAIEAQAKQKNVAIKAAEIPSKTMKNVAQAMNDLNNSNLELDHLKLAKDQITSKEKQAVLKAKVDLEKIQADKEKSKSLGRT